MLLIHIFAHHYLISVPISLLDISDSPQTPIYSLPSKAGVWIPLPSFLFAKRIIIYLICMILSNFLSNLIVLQVYLPCQGV